MSELSRMQRHQSRNKGRKNKTSAQSQKGKTTKVGQEEETWGHPTSSNSARAGMKRTQSSAATEGLSRSRSSRSARATMEEELAPKRTNTYSSYRVRMSKWFVNSLIIVFILLMAALLWWGLIGAPPLSELLKEIL
ncbi:hypothetical protein AMS62_00455 [Bacillus sp. FJAT-18019]|uniref:Uncharacterized protein n=1 Tax=Paenibacillus solani TaxID=1705565 RepID=A0A0M1P2K8_9BACL|nr:hypothetical protein [Paenibacillus solani]KOP63866.1 hypothetical protein AMS62_00455 [Bacillus sp. FJAT-18019]KOR88716.1 hypothetical protein AM231_05745 [Paenibacillus solani]